MQTNNKQTNGSTWVSVRPHLQTAAPAQCIVASSLESSLLCWASGSDLSCALQAPVVNNSDMTTHRTGSWGPEGVRGLARAEFGVTLGACVGATGYCHRTCVKQVAELALFIYPPLVLGAFAKLSNAAFTFLMVSVFHCGMRSSLFWDVTRCWLVVSYWPFGTISPIFKCLLFDHLREERSRNVGNHPSTLCNFPEERRFSN
jgi:hypothetical protein